MVSEKEIEAACKANARNVATIVARRTAAELAEAAANEYLQAEIPAIIAAYSALGQAEISDETADEVAKNQNDGR